MEISMAVVIVLSLCLFLSGCSDVGTNTGAGTGTAAALGSDDGGSGDAETTEGARAETTEGIGDADTAESYTLAAEECLEKGEKAEAAQYLYKAYLLDESRTELALEAARLYIEAGDYESAAGIMDGGTGVSYVAVLFGEEDMPEEVSERRRELEEDYMELLLELKGSLEQELYDIENIHDILSWDIFAEDRQEEWRGFYELAEGLGGWAQVWQLEDGSWLGVYPGGYIYFGEMSGGLRNGQGRWLRYFGAADAGEITDADGAGETPDEDGAAGTAAATDEDGAAGKSGAAGSDAGEATDVDGAAGTAETPDQDGAAGTVAATDEDGAAGKSGAVGTEDAGEISDVDGAAGIAETPDQDGAVGNSSVVGSDAGDEAEGISDIVGEEDADISGAAGTAKSVSGEEAVGISGVVGADSAGMCAAVYYEGEWAEDSPNGMGLYCRKYSTKYGGNTVIYEMEFADGRAQGEGIMALLSDDPDMVGDCDIMAADGYLEPGFAEGDDSTPPHAVWPEIAGRVIPKHWIAVPGV